MQVKGSKTVGQEKNLKVTSLTHILDLSEYVVTVKSIVIGDGIVVTLGCKG